MPESLSMMIILFIILTFSSFVSCKYIVNDRLSMIGSTQATGAPNLIDEEITQNEDILEINNSTETEEYNNYYSRITTTAISMDLNQNETDQILDLLSRSISRSRRFQKIAGTTEDRDYEEDSILPNYATTTAFPTAESMSGSEGITWTVTLYRETRNRQNWTSIAGHDQTCKNVGSGANYSTVRSVNTHNNCVRLYKGRNCSGAFRDSKPGSNCDWHLFTCEMTNQVASVSSCSYRNANSLPLLTTTESLRILTTTQPPIYSRDWQLTLYAAVGGVNETAHVRGSNSSQDCQNINPNHIYLRVSSVNTHDGCVRLYDDFDCNGSFEESKPASTCDWNLDWCQMTNKVASASSCLYSQPKVIFRPTPSTTTTQEPTTSTTPEEIGDVLGSEDRDSIEYDTFYNRSPDWALILSELPRNEKEFQMISGAYYECKDLKKNGVASKDVGSINILGHCIRLYKGRFCEGEFSEINDDKINNHCRQKPGFCGFHEIRSITSCLYDSFQ